MIPFQENTWKDSTIEGWTDPISWDYSGYHRGSNKYNCSRLALKLKDIEYNVDLTKNYYITVRMQNIRSIYKLILIIQQILGSHKLNGNDHFWVLTKVRNELKRP